MDDILLIGVDGGATEVKAHAVACANWAQPAGFTLRAEAAARVYGSAESFAALPVAEQLAQRDAGRIELTPSERERGTAWLAAAADAITEVAHQAAARRALVGIGMPGLKTPDGRGIAVINNGPRMPEYLAELERQLAQRGVTLAAPVAALGSDADYCGLGEEHAADGLFRDVQNAYYVGCGTGIADALKLRGQLVPFDATKTWLLKSWQIPSALGPTFEKLVSAKSLNTVYAGLCGRNDEFPEAAAAQGALPAITWLDTAALVLAELIFERLSTILHGRTALPHRGDAYVRLQRDHAYVGTVLDRVIIGQRLGLIYADPRGYRPFAARLEACLAALMADDADDRLRSAYLAGAGLRPGLMSASQLRAAPALGAAVAAVRAFRAPA